MLYINILMCTISFIKKILNLACFNKDFNVNKTLSENNNCPSISNKNLIIKRDFEQNNNYNIDIDTYAIIIDEHNKFK